MGSHKDPTIVVSEQSLLISAQKLCKNKIFGKVSATPELQSSEPAFGGLAWSCTPLVENRGSESAIILVIWQNKQYPVS